MSSESEIRSRYLALALDTRRVIDTLIVFVDKGTRTQGFDESLQQVIDSLEATEKREVFSPLRNRLAFSEYYEQVRTVHEALKPGEMGRIIQKLSTVKSQDADLNERKSNAFEAIKLLSAIESRALYYYRPQP
jgi:hypothetical protein